MISTQNLKLELHGLQKAVVSSQQRELDLDNQVKQLFIDKAGQDLEISRLKLELVQQHNNHMKKNAAALLKIKQQTKKNIVKELCDLWRTNEFAAELMYGETLLI